MSQPAQAFERAIELHRKGQLAQAIAAYDALLERWPAHAETLHYSGVALYQSGRLDAAQERLERSLQSEPNAAPAWCNLALVLQARGQADAAIAALNEAVGRNPGVPALWNNLGTAFFGAGRFTEAETAIRRTLEIDAGDVDALFILACCREAQGRLDEALKYCDAALQAEPGAIAPAGLKAQIEEAQGRFDTAISTLTAALAHNGDLPSAAPLHFQRAGLEERQGRLLVAGQSLRRALQIDPRYGAALSDLLFLHKQLADWQELPALRRQFLAGVSAGLSHLSPFSLQSDPSTRAQQRRCAETWSRSFPALAEAPRRPTGDPVRIAYLSADYCQHATAVLAAGLFEQHDRRRFHVTAYSTGTDDASAMRARLVAGFDRFVDAHGWDAGRLAEQIAADNIDVLIDLKGHTHGATTAVLALRPAPIQVNYLGFPGTMGAAFIDYLIGDAIVTPFEHAADYAETLVQLPACYQINDRQRAIADPPTRAQLGLPDDAFVFCCFNQAYKLNPEVFDAWARILAGVPQGVLWLLGGNASADRSTLEANLSREAAARGIDSRRLVFAARRSNAEYLGLYRRADLFLDSWPYNAHTTASDSLWAGCPVLTFLGDTFAGRVAASLLTAVGLPELIAPDVDGYVGRALALANAEGTLAHCRLHLASTGRASALFDTAATTRALEAAYLRMIEQASSGERAPFRVDSDAR
ncbi:MAG: tetratricopeptide repeat protein [Casimicrobiaceae bacterium]